MATEEICPDCGAGIAVDPGYVVWCSVCNWNMDPERQQQKLTFMDRLNRRMGQKAVDDIRDEVHQGREVRHPWTWSTTFAYLIAIGVHALTLFCYYQTATRFVFLRTMGDLFLGLLFFLISIHLFPLVSKLPKPVLTREQYPAIYQILDRLAAELGARPVHHVVLLRDYNAYFTTVGFLGKRVIGIGIPLFAAMDSQEKMAVLAHEMAHNANRDLTRSWFVGSAFRTLWRWFQFVAPDPNSSSPWPRLVWIRRLLAMPILGLWYFMGMSVWQESQRAEYDADRCAAGQVGKDAMLRALEKLHFRPTYELTVARIATFKFTRELFDEFRSRVKLVPAKERLRLERLLQSHTARLDATHPPSRYRLDYIRSLRELEKTVCPDQMTIEAFEAEFIELEHAVQLGILDDYRSWRLEHRKRPVPERPW